MRMLMVLKFSLIFFMSLVVLAIVLSWANIHNEALITTTVVALFISAIFIWLFPVLIVLVQKNLKDRILLGILSLALPVFGGVICYFVLGSRVNK